jgi:asparagine synthase (glutamine-hydrolysing)
MSIIFGVRKSEEDVVAERQLLDLAQTTDRWAPDGTLVRAQGRIGMGFQPYHTHQRSNLDSQPVVDELGNMVTLDGRLDNHGELRELLGINDPDTPDSLIALTAFKHWGGECFARLIGDWALAIWSQIDRSLYLARDHAGTRTLYFEDAQGQLLWSTYLDSFFGDKQPRKLNEQYVAAYLACSSIGDLTPYKGIRSVMPAHFVVLREGTLRQVKHWECLVKERIHYRTDVQFEEHFFALFKQSVERRSGQGAPILAHLSGGMDSSSIVCMSDHIRKASNGTSPDFLDTMSYYDRSEPHWNEAPYYSLVEAQREKTGIHIDVGSAPVRFQMYPESGCPDPLPGSDATYIDREQRIVDSIRLKTFRVILSGMGGDELLGGNPTPLPELADYIYQGKPSTIGRNTLQWCLNLRRPFVHLLFEAVTFSISIKCAAEPIFAPWISTENAPRAIAPHSYWQTLRNTPSSVYNARSWLSLLDSLPHLHPLLLDRKEHRYPYLDRNIVDFLLRVPRSQLVRPGLRRCLMRRTMRSIVPSGILDRRRKAYITRGPLMNLQHCESLIGGRLDDSPLAAFQFFSPSAYREALRKANRGEGSAFVGALMRVPLLDLWIRGRIGAKLLSASL